ncbi:MAG: thymidine kinase [Mycoplasmoidaceae bacterium]
MTSFKTNRGWIELICGPMFAGKTEELLRKINRASYAKLETVIFKPVIDTRNKNLIKSRSLQSRKAIEINDSIEILKYIKELKSKPRIIAIDEIQFFNESIINIVNSLANEGFILFISGLDLDFKGEPFTITAKLAALAEYVNKLSAICTICGEPGTITQRLINGEPAEYNSKIILIGNTESYSVRCRKHHKVSGKIK